MPVARYDIGTLKAPVKTSQGFLRVDAFLTRTGIFEYRNADGSVRRELRKAENVFDGAAVDSFALSPVTDEHPPTMLTTDNVRDYQRGYLGDTVTREGNFLRASMLVTDAALITKMEQGKKQISCGYLCDLDMTPGEFQGQKYDAVQKNIRGNHVAVVDSGRAGEACAARMDSGTLISKDIPTMKITIDGVSFEVDESAGQAFVKYDTAMRVAVEAAKAEAGAANGRADAEKAARIDAQDKFPARVAARVALEKSAAAHLGEMKLDALSDLDVKVVVIEKLGDVKLTAEQKADAAYVAGRFDSALDFAAKAPNAELAKARKVADAAVTGSDVPADVKARADMITHVRTLKPIPGAVVKN
jgi:hypothetical protein